MANNNQNKPYAGKIYNIGTCPFVAGTKGNELHCVIAEAAKMQPNGKLREIATEKGKSKLVKYTVPLKGRAETIKKYFPSTKVGEDGTVFVTLTAWNHDAEIMAQAGESIRFRAAGSLYEEPWEGHDPVLTFNVACVSEVRPRIKNNGQPGSNAAPAAPAAPAAAPPQFGNAAAPVAPAAAPQFAGQQQSMDDFTVIDDDDDLPF